jgi:glycosyltransferase involved in cell wall biosynthesis
MTTSLVRAGHKASIIYLHFGQMEANGTDLSSGVDVHHAPVGNLHYYLHRMMLGASSIPRVVRGLETSYRLRRLLESIHERTPVDLIEVPEVFITPTVTRGLPYVMRLHAADWALRHLLGEKTDSGNQLERKLESAALAGTAGVSSPSRALASFISDACTTRGRIEVIPYPVDIDKFAPRSEPIAENSVLFVGRVERRKGAHVLTGAIPKIRAAVPGCMFVFAGRIGEDMTELLKRNADAVTLLGSVPREDLVRWYQRSTVFVAPTLWDNSPNTVYEAMSCGTPVVASNVGGIPELVDDGVTGLLVPHSDSDALSSAVVRILTDDGLRARLGKCSREKVVSSYSVERIAKTTLDFYTSLLSRTN